MNRHSRLKQAQRRLTLESLENRSLMAGDVTTGLIHKYTFDETSGDFAQDSVGTNTASLGNWGAAEQKWTAGAIGGGLDFDGVDNFVITSANISVNQYSVSFWLFRQGNGGINPRIANPQGLMVPNVAWNREASKGIGVFTDGGNVVDSVAPPAGVWTHYVAVVDTVGGTATVYRNGNQVATNTIAANAPNALWVFGHDQDLGNQSGTLDGILDELRIYNRQLTAAEALDLANFSTGPVVNVNNTAAYTENGTGVRLSPNATVTDVNNANFAGGSLAVSIAGGTSNDRVFVQSNGTADGQINVTGDTNLFQVTFGNVEIGTFSGAESSSLTIALNANATPAATQALLRQIFFRVEGDNPGSSPRQVEFVVADGTSETSVPATVTVNVTAVNDAPVLGGISGTVDYVEDGPAIAIAPLGTVSDVDNANFANGSLTAAVTGGTASSADRLSILSVGTAAGQISVTGDVNLFQVRFGGTEIGTFSGAAGSTLTVALNGNATPATVQALVRNLRYKVEVDNPTTTQRQIEIQLDDGSGAQSNVATLAVDVTDINDAPVIAGVGSVNFTENTAGSRLAGAATVTDIDNANFNLGVLNIAITTATRKAGDQIFIRTGGQIAVTAGTTSSTVTFGGTQIGTFTGSGPTLQVKLNSSATPAGVQALLRQVYFRNTSQNPATTQRQFAIVLHDGVDSSRRVSGAIDVTAVNDAPQLGGISGSVVYPLNTPSRAIAPRATLTDVDSANFAGGILTVSILRGADASNRIELGGTLFTLSGRQIKRGNVVIGTLNAGGGVGRTNFEVTFTAQATGTIVQQVVRSLRFRTENSSLHVDRKLAFSLTDGDGGKSANQIKTMDVF